MILLLAMLACKDEPAVTPDDSEVNDSVGGDDTIDETDEPTESCLTEPRVAVGEHTCALEATCSFVGETSREYFAVKVASGGDLDGDGKHDLVTGAPGYAPGDGDTYQAGRVAIITSAQLAEPGRAVSAWVNGVDGSEFTGSSVAIVSDVNGDGVDDLLYGAMGRADGGEDAGVAALVYGQAGGFGDAGTVLSPVAEWTGQAYDRAGYAVGAAGDMNGDGLGEMWVSGGIKDTVDDDEDWDIGTAYLILGSSDHTSGSLDTADAAFTGERSKAATGHDFAQGDLDGDGYDDGVIGAPYGGVAKGRVWLIQGSGTLPLGASLLDDTATARVDGDQYYDAFGWAVAAGDLNGDGADELIVGAPLNDDADNTAGAVYVYQGGPAIFDEPVLLASFTGEWMDAQFGNDVGAGDLDGDGLAELVAGGIGSWRGLVTKGGRVSVVPGSADGWSAGVPIASVSTQVNGAAVKDYLGSATALGDVDGDGKADLWIGGGYVNGESLFDVGAAYLFLSP